MSDINEALIQFGTRSDEYMVLPVTVLATLQRLQVNQEWLLCWRKLGDREVLVAQPWSKPKPGPRTGPRKSRFILDKDGRTVSRRWEEGVMRLWWQQ